jgi:hypothetical protein
VVKAMTWKHRDASAFTTRCELVKRLAAELKGGRHDLSRCRLSVNDLWWLSIVSVPHCVVKVTIRSRYCRTNLTL